MIPKDLDERCKMIEYMLEGLESAELNDREREMILSFKEQYERNKKFSFQYNKTLSDRQCEILEQIYDRNC